VSRYGTLSSCAVQIPTATLCIHVMPSVLTLDGGFRAASITDVVLVWLRRCNESTFDQVFCHVVVSAQIIGIKTTIHVVAMHCAAKLGKMMTFLHNTSLRRILFTLAKVESRNLLVEKKPLVLGIKR
jgi:hypothetical protein